MRRGRERSIAAAVWCVALAAGPAAALPALRVDGGSGVPGGTAAAVVTLSDDPTGQAVSASLTLTYPSPPLETSPGDCSLAERLEGSHHLSTAVPSPGTLDLVVSPRAGTPPIGNGALVRCDFGIALGTPAGTAALMLSAQVENATGDPIPVDTVDGAIVVDAPLPTPTLTHTPAITLTPTATPTPTDTPVPIPTDTPTATPTATRFVPIVLADNIGGCAIVPRADGGALPLLGGLLLLLARRRRQWPVPVTSVVLRLEGAALSAPVEEGSGGRLRLSEQAPTERRPPGAGGAAPSRRTTGRLSFAAEVTGTGH